MRPYLLVLLGCAAIVLLSPAIAEECTPTTSEPEVTAGRYYVDNDPCQPECLFSVWIYEESNDIPGLQRQDEVKDDTCGGMIEGDTGCLCALLPMAPVRRGRVALVGPAPGASPGATPAVAAPAAVASSPFG